jgi:hypothetical protein
VNEDEILNIEGVPDHGYISARELLLTSDNIPNTIIDTDGERHVVGMDERGVFYRINDNESVVSLRDLDFRRPSHSAWWDMVDRPMRPHENFCSDKAVVIESFNKKCENCNKEDCIVINCFMEFLFDNYHVIRK